MYNKAKLYQHSTDWQQFKELRHKVHSLLREQHWQYLTNILTNILTITNDYGNANKPLWQYIKCQCQDKVGIGTLNASDSAAVIHPLKYSLILKTTWSVELINNCTTAIYVYYNNER